MGPDNRDRQAPASSRHAELSYALVADADVQRTAACLESIKAFRIGALVARDGEEALGILRRFGAPVLLVTDLSLPRTDGFALIEAVREIDGGRTEIIAWSAVRELREFATHRLAGLNVRILSGSAAPAVLRGAIERALKGATAPVPRPAAAANGPAANAAGSGAVDDMDRTIADLLARARQVCGAAGIAVYLRAPGQMQFRASVTWTSEVPMPDSPPHIPRVFDIVLETGDALVFPDLDEDSIPGLPRSLASDEVRGLVAVPVLEGDGQIVGAICVFDVEPVEITEPQLEALKALGRRNAAVPRAAAERPEPPPGEEPRTEQPSQEVRREEFAEPHALEPLSLLDRRGGGMAIARELARVRREQRQLSVVLFDVDPIGAREGAAGVRGPNVDSADRAEHAESGRSGDSADAFEAATETLTKAIRGSDLAIQWSSEELLVVLPGLNATEARQVAERVRAAMQAGARHRVSVAGGVAELLANESVESAVARANEKVRLARERGHNRVG